MMTDLPPGNSADLQSIYFSDKQTSERKGKQIVLFKTPELLFQKFPKCPRKINSNADIITLAIVSLERKKGDVNIFILKQHMNFLTAET